MNAMRGAAKVAGGALLLAWAAAANLPEPAAPVAPGPARPSEIRSTGAIELQTGQLRARLGSRPTLKASLRNPFKFGSGPAPAVGMPAPPSKPAAPTVPSPPPLVLSGIAEQDTPSGVQRTAVISDFARLFLVKEGETVTERFRVERIGADAVELRDTLNGATIRLGLR